MGDELKKVIEKKNSEVKELQASIERYKSSLSNYKEKLAQEKMIRKDSERELTERISKNENYIQSLQEMLEKKDEQSNTTNAEEKLHALHDTLHMLQSEYEQSIETIRKQNSEISSYSQHNKTLEERIERLTSEMDNIVNQNKKKIAQIESETEKQMNSHKEHYESRIEGLKSDVHFFKSELTTIPKNNIEYEFKNLKSEYDLLSNHFQKVESELL